MKKVLIIGANRGIGLELAKTYKGRGDEVTAVCRQASEPLQDMGVSVIEGVDVTQEPDLQKLSKELKGDFDVLIHNAGIMRRETIDDMNFETIEEQLQVNAMAPLRAVQSLKSHLKEGGKIGLMTSRMGSIEDNNSGAYYGYRMSKAALNAGGRSLAIDLKPLGIAVALLHPGFVKTDMTGHNGDITPDVAAQRLAERMDDLSVETTGRFWHSAGQELPW